MSYRNPGKTPIQDYTAGLTAFQTTFDKYAGKVKEIKDLQAKEQKEIDDANAALAAGKNSVIEAAFKISQSMGDATRSLVEGIINNIPSGGFASLSGAEKENVFSQLRLIKQASDGLNYNPDNPGNSKELLDLFNKLRNQEIDWQADIENKTLKLGDYSIGQLQAMITSAGEFKEDPDLEMDTLNEMDKFVQTQIKNARDNQQEVTPEMVDQLIDIAAKQKVFPDNKSWSYVWQNAMDQNDKNLMGYPAYDYRYNEFDLDDADTREAFRLNRNLTIEKYMSDKLKQQANYFNLYKEKPKTTTAGSKSSTIRSSNEQQGADLARQYYKEFIDVPDDTQIQSFNNINISLGQGISGKITSAMKRGDNLILDITSGTGQNKQTQRVRFTIGGDNFAELLPILINDRIKKASVSMGVKSPAYLSSKNIYQEFFQTITPLQQQYDFSSMPGVSQSYD